MESRDILVSQSGGLEPSTDSTTNPDSEDLATPYVENNQFNIEQAEYYDQLSNNQPGAINRIDSILSSAEYYVQANDYGQAQNTVDNLNINQLSTVQFNRYSIIKAYVDYSAGEFENALQRLSGLLAKDRIQDTEELNAGAAFESIAIENVTQRVDALLLGSFCYQQLNNYDAAISALIYRESLLVGSARAESARYTWQVINSLNTQLRSSIVEQTTDVLVRNRLEQSMDGQFADQTDLPPQFDQWRNNSDGTNKQLIDSNWGANSPQKIAILLPLTSRYSKAAHAVMDGLEYQHNANTSPYKPTIDFFDVGAEPAQVSQYYSSITQMGYDLVIGPIGKDYANNLTTSAINQFSASVPIILLGGDTDLSNQSGNTFSRLTISPEADGIEVADHAKRQGHVTAAILTPNNDYGQRSSNAFKQRWLGQGGNISKAITYSPTQFDHSVELKQLFEINQSEYRHTRISNTLGFRPEFSAYRRSDVDFIFMIADNESGRIVRPQINFFTGKTVPVYATSSVFNGIQDEVNNLDLEQTHFPILPWVLQSADIAPYAGQLNILFAMGGDAYEVASNYQTMRNNPDIAVTGNMGSLHIEQSGDIIFQPIWAQFKQGLARPDTELPAIKGGYQLPSNSNQATSKGLNNYDDSNWDSRRSSRKTGVSIP